MVELSVKDSIQQSPQVVELPRDEVKWCAVSISDVFNVGKRLNASVFDFEVRHAISAIENSVYPTRLIVGNKNGFAYAYRPDICKRIFVGDQNNGIPMLTPSQITELKPNAEKYLSFKMQEDIADWFVKKGEILLTCSGTIGKIALVTKTLELACVSQNLIRIVAQGIDVGFLYAFLRTKAGQILLTKNKYGAVIQHIDPDHLKQIKVPDPPNDIKVKINDLIMRSYDFRDKANDLIDKAHSLLISELHLMPIREFKVEKFDNRSDIDSYCVPLSNINGRLDGSYHVPIVKAIMDHLYKHAGEVTTIGDTRISKAIILPGRFKRVYVNEKQGVKFLGGKEIDQLVPHTEKYISKKVHKSQLSSEILIKEHSILTPARGTIGSVTLAPHHFYGWAISDNLIQIVCHPETVGYLYIFLNTSYGTTLIKRFIYGGVVDALEPFHLSCVEVPLLKNKVVQNEINRLALEANALRYEAYKLEQEALRIMNDEIIFSQ